LKVFMDVLLVGLNWRYLAQRSSHRDEGQVQKVRARKVRAVMRRGQPETAKRAHCAKRNRTVRTSEERAGQSGPMVSNRTVVGLKLEMSAVIERSEIIARSAIRLM
jgi:hypothetical protein